MTSLLTKKKIEILENVGELSKGCGCIKRLLQRS